MLGKAPLKENFYGQWYTKEGIRPTMEDVHKLTSRLNKNGYKTHVVRVESETEKKGYAYAVYARSAV